MLSDQLLDQPVFLVHLALSPSFFVPSPGGSRRIGEHQHHIIAFPCRQRGSGCDVATCVAHLLTGAPLLLRPLDWSIEFSHGCGINRRSATINIL